MKLLFPPNPLKYSPPLLSYDRVLAGGVSGFQPESVNPVNELEFSVSSLENFPSQSVFYQKPTETIPERVSERFIAGSPPSLPWSAPKLNPNGDSGQRVQGGGQNPVRPSLGQKQSVRLSAWSENPLSSPVVCGDKKGSFVAENLSGKTAIQSVQPVWDLLEIVVQKDTSREEDVSDFRSPSPAATEHSAAQIGAEHPRRYGSRGRSRPPRGKIRVVV